MAPARRRTPSMTAALLGLALAAAAAAPGLAQTPAPGLVLHVRRLFGYGAGAQIQGSFRLEVDGPAGLASVTYRLDGAVLTTTTQAPFSAGLNTDDYPAGPHTLTAEAVTADGRPLAAEPRHYEFVAASSVLPSVAQLFLPLIAALAAAALLTAGASALAGRRPAPTASPRTYGLLGGAVCPKCGRAFPRHLWGIHVGLGYRLDRCERCGRWSWVRRASPAELEAAQAAEAPAPEGHTQPSAESRLKRGIDDTRFVD